MLPHHPTQCTPQNIGCLSAGQARQGRTWRTSSRTSRSPSGTRRAALSALVPTISPDGGGHSQSRCPASRQTAQASFSCVPPHRGGGVPRTLGGCVPSQPSTGFKQKPGGMRASSGKPGGVGRGQPLRPTTWGKQPQNPPSPHCQPTSPLGSCQES